MPPFYRSLKFQIVAALVLQVGLFAITIGFLLRVVEHQHRDDLLLRLAAQLQLSEQQLAMQAMHYKDNAPPDYPSYHRDLQLYYRDLQDHRQRFSDIVDAFASGKFGDDMDGMDMNSGVRLDLATRQAAAQLRAVWQSFNAVLNEKLGPNREAPRLEWAAEFVIAEHLQVEKAVANLLNSLQTSVDRNRDQAKLLGQVTVVASLIGSLLIVGWFLVRVLRPLDKAVQGFDQVANGDFATRLQVQSGNEIDSLISDFNRLADRLQALLQLITRLQQGQDLQQSLRNVAETLPRLLPLDWCGLLTQGADGLWHLQASLGPDSPLGQAQRSFEPNDTVQHCLAGNGPCRLTLKQSHQHDALIDFIRRQSLGDALALPLPGDGDGAALLLLATRASDQYQQDHLDLLDNLSPLLGASFARSVALAESTRLAAIGEFASGVVHELRTPLATVGLALEHFERQPGLDAGSRRRVELAASELGRLTRLLDDILRYARPLTLEPRQIELGQLLDAPALRHLLESPWMTVAQTDLNRLPPLFADQERLQQVLINLLDNALAANGDDPRGVELCARADGDWIEIRIRNGGEPLSEAALERAFQPFYTSKRGGTGLGLPIVQRIVRAHGGEVVMQSSAEFGTEVKVRLPLRGDAWVDLSANRAGAVQAAV